MAPCDPHQAVHQCGPENEPHSIPGRVLDVTWPEFYPIPGSTLDAIWQRYIKAEKGTSLTTILRIDRGYIVKQLAECGAAATMPGGFSVADVMRNPQGKLVQTPGLVLEFALHLGLLELLPCPHGCRLYRRVKP